MSQPHSIAKTLRRPIADPESRESIALVIGAAAFVLGGLVALVVFWGRTLPISGRGSLGDFVGIAAAIAAMAAFVVGCVLRRRQASADGVRTASRVRWFDIAALTLAHGVIALLGWVGLAAILSLSFLGATVYAPTAAVLAGVAVALTAYVATLSAVNLTPMLLSLVLAVFLVVGALASMLSAPDPLWWQKNLSTLGISDSISSLAFNLTLIIAGIMVTTIAHYATEHLPHRTPEEKRGRSLVRLALVLIGVGLACVGLFPVDEYLSIHNLSATGMAIVYVILVVALRWLVPSMPKVFILLGYVFVAVIVVLAAFFVTGYYNLTAVELVAGVLIFSWLIVFLRNTGAMEDRDAGTVRAAEPAVASSPGDDPLLAAAR